MTQLKTFHILLSLAKHVRTPFSDSSAQFRNPLWFHYIQYCLQKRRNFFFHDFSRQFLLFLSFHCWTITEWQWQEIQAFFWWWSYHHLNVKVKLPIVVNYHFNFLYKWIFNPLISKGLQALKSMRWGKPPSTLNELPS